MKAFIARLIVGATVFVLGSALLLDTLDIVDTIPILGQWWPLFIILGGIVIVVNDIKNYIWALLVIFFGTLTQLQVLGYTDINPWQVFWPVVLIIIGVSIVLRRPALPRKESRANSDDIVAILGGSDQRNSSEDFTAARATAILGGAKIDLRKATIRKSATIEIFTLMGGVELVVPRGVIIKNKTNVIMGGVENKTDQEISKDAPTLMVVGDVIMGGVEIKN